MGKSNTQKKSDSPSIREVPIVTPATAADADKLIHERTRLAIISSLAVNPSLSFSELKALLKLSDGNLSVHAQKLEAAGFIKCTKSFEGRTPRTEYAITGTGKKALEKYLNHMEQLIARVRDSG